MADRECGSCTACCEGWLVSEKMSLKPGSSCTHCTKVGCGIYATRPVSPCIQFKCAWLESDKIFPEEMRPDRCGAIVMFDRKWKGLSVIAAVPTGPSIPEVTLEQLRKFARKNTIPLVFSNNQFEDGVFGKTIKTGYGPPAFVEKVRKSIGDDDIIRL